MGYRVRVLTFLCKMFVEIKLVEGWGGGFSHCGREGGGTELGHRALKLGGN